MPSVMNTTVNIPTRKIPPFADYCYAIPTVNLTEDGHRENVDLDFRNFARSHYERNVGSKLPHEVRELS